MMACALCLAAAGCQTAPRVTEPCDLLTVIPDAPPAVNAVLVRDARPTALGLARHKARVKAYRCG